MSTGQKPVGADLLHLFGPWLAGVELAAGRCLQSTEPAARQLLGQRCGVEGCRSLVCGTADDDLAEHLSSHRRRCHG
ncbi:MAG TPA: hypothetical protein VGX25_00535 [Actinophytocola sp.]|uniref:hypothetical protein n=1 Tax=Actinophytocola sp. TaxID=1872138 RepID=UPI002DDCF3C9|nr:hypothetical protein [Actinophytocola sp.]HEV2777865.1 hypothetical protein [Actinophytocola sp.]